MPNAGRSAARSMRLTLKQDDAGLIDIRGGFAGIHVYGAVATETRYLQTILFHRRHMFGIGIDQRHGQAAFLQDRTK